MPEVDGKKYDYDEKGIKDAAVASAPKEPTDADVVEAMGITTSEEKEDLYDLAHSKAVLKNATPEQKAKAREDLDIPEGMNMGGVVVDELGYMKGGMSYDKRQPVKYSKGGAVKGKNFSGTF
jgi:hypothetical protein